MKSFEFLQRSGERGLWVGDVDLCYFSSKHGASVLDGERHSEFGIVPGGYGGSLQAGVLKGCVREPVTEGEQRLKLSDLKSSVTDEDTLDVPVQHG